MNILLTLILIVNLAALAIILAISWKVRQIYEDFKVFITAPDTDHASPASDFVNGLVSSAGRSIAMEIKAIFMGKQSGAVRGEAAITADIAEDALAIANPTLSAILNSFPALKRTLRRNPQLTELAIQKLANFAPQNSGPSNDSGNGHQPKFKM
jgi:hypothetical protein